MKTGRTRITEAVVKGAPYPDRGQEFKRDSVDIGLALRLTPGSKTFVYEGMARGRMHRVKLGGWPDLSVAAARRRARWYGTEISQGRDPFAEREKKRQGDEDALTFGELAAKYIEDHAKAGPDGKPRCRSWWRMERRLKQHFGAWEHRRLDDITAGAAAKAHSRIAAKHGEVEANRALQLLRTVFNRAIKWKVYAGDNPASDIAWYDEDPETHTLSPIEHDRVEAAIGAEPDWRWQAYFTLLLQLGTRRTELISAKWAEIDFERGILTLPKANTKTKKTREIALPAQAMDILRDLPSRQSGEWVFPGSGKNGHLVEVKAAWERIRTRASVRHIKVHDLRRTVATDLHAQGEGIATIQRVLGHSRISTTERYLKPGLEAQREALERNAALRVRARQSKGTQPQ
jgi:integrase